MFITANFIHIQIGTTLHMDIFNFFFFLLDRAHSLATSYSQYSALMCLFRCSLSFLSFWFPLWMRAWSFFSRRHSRALHCKFYTLFLPYSLLIHSLTLVCMCVYCWYNSSTIFLLPVDRVWHNLDVSFHIIFNFSNFFSRLSFPLSLALSLHFSIMRAFLCVFCFSFFSSFICQFIDLFSVIYCIFGVVGCVCLQTDCRFCCYFCTFFCFFIRLYILFYECMCTN